MSIAINGKSTSLKAGDIIAFVDGRVLLLRNRFPVFWKSDNRNEISNVFVTSFLDRRHYELLAELIGTIHGFRIERVELPQVRDSVAFGFKQPEKLEI